MTNQMLRVCVCTNAKQETFGRCLLTSNISTNCPPKKDILHIFILTHNIKWRTLPLNFEG